MTDLDALRQAEDPSAPWPSRAAAARRVAAAAPGAHDGRLDALQAAFLDPAIARQIPVGLRVAFWTAVGDRNLVARTHARWIDVPAAPGWVGPVPGDPHTRDREGPGQMVELPAFRIQAWPVTVAEYALFLADDASRTADPGDPSPTPRHVGHTRRR
ncbi:MAG: hypothetical protein R3F43_20220 [bacterium]